MTRKQINQWAVILAPPRLRAATRVNSRGTATLSRVHLDRQATMPAVNRLLADIRHRSAGGILLRERIRRTKRPRCGRFHEAPPQRKGLGLVLMHRSLRYPASAGGTRRKRDDQESPARNDARQDGEFVISGTGIFAAQLLGRGSRIFAIPATAPI
jgi:hypothetical protein